MIFVADIFNTPRAFQEKCASEVEYDYESVAGQSLGNNIMDLDQVDHGSTVSNNRNHFYKIIYCTIFPFFSLLYIKTNIQLP